MRTENKPVIDYTRVAEGFLFDTPRLRCQYLGKTTSEKPRWLEEHKGQYQRVEDVLRVSAQPPDDVGAARTESTSDTSCPRATTLITAWPTARLRTNRNLCRHP